jgi:hypothetical protein
MPERIQERPRKALKSELRREINNLRRIGEQMSNVCFNLAQDRNIEARHRVTMDELRRKWDDIKRAEATHADQRIGGK